MVPVSVFVEDRRTEIRSFLGCRFKSNVVPRIVIIGAPGSGKSIALGDIARYLPTLDRTKPIVPVLLTFSDLKGTSDKEGLEGVIATKLQRDQFTEFEFRELLFSFDPVYYTLSLYR